MKHGYGIYARISRDSEETGLGVGRQLADCEALAATRKLAVVERYIDNDVSATRSRVRPEYARMLADAKSGRINGIIVWDVDRLTRTPRELEDIIDLADTLGLDLASVGGFIDLGTPQGQLTARIKGSVARHETDQLSRRLKRKFLERAQSGEPHNFPPYGYRAVRDTDDRGRVVKIRHDVYEPEAEAVRFMAEKLIAGLSLRSIARELNERGTKTTRGNNWASQTVRRTVMRPYYAGIKVFHGEIVGDGTWPAILDRQTHVQIVEILKDPTRRTQRGSARKHLLTGLLKCGRCGSPMIRVVGAANGRAKDGTVKLRAPSYACHGCYRCARKQEHVDEVVIGAVIARLQRPDALAALSTGDVDQQKTAIGEIEALEARLDDAATQYAEGVLTAKQLGTITRVTRDKLEAAHAVMASFTIGTGVVDLAGPKAAERWEVANLETKRAVIDALMSIRILPVGPGVRFDPEQVEITWRHV